MTALPHLGIDKRLGIRALAAATALLTALEIGGAHV